MGFPVALAGALSSFVGGLTPLVTGKFESDLNQRSAREAAEKSRDISVEMFNLNKEENLAAFNRNVAREDVVWEKNKSLADANWEREKAYNMEMWNAQNQYNSPAAQMERFKQAGINPLMVASQGTPGNAVAVRGSELGTPEEGSTSYDAAHAEGSGMSATSTRIPDARLLGMLMDYMAIRNADQELKNKAAQNSLLNEQARSLKISNDYQERYGNKLDPLFIRMGGRLLNWLGTQRENINREYNMQRQRGGDVRIPFLINTQGAR